MMSTEQLSNYEDVEGLVSPRGLPDLLLAEVARDLPLAIAAMAVSSDDNEYLRLVMDDPAYVDYVGIFDAFKKWVVDTHQGNVQGWLEYLVDTRAKVLDRTAVAYELPEDAVEIVGDELLGSAIFFSFLNAAGVVSDEDEVRFSNLWTFLLVNDLFSDEDVDVVDEQVAQKAPEAEEW